MVLRYGRPIRTVSEGVFKLPPGTMLSVRAGSGVPCHRPIADSTTVVVARSDRRGRAANPIHPSDGELRTNLIVCCACRRATDAVHVPLGAFLSGGLDSSTAVALMQARRRAQSALIRSDFAKRP
jgi:asparagine synthetase B (glutamine-hydrolysing)